MNSNINIDKINNAMLLYLEFLYKRSPEKLVDIKYKLPEELFDFFEVTINNYDRDEYKDYSSGSKRIMTNRYYTHQTFRTFYNINSKNFLYFLKICKKLIDEKSDLNYYKYMKSRGSFEIFYKNYKEDYYDVVEFIKRHYFKFIED